MSKRTLHAVVLCLSFQLAAAEAWSQRIQLAPAMEREERIKVARLILDSRSLDKDLTKPENRMTDYRVLIDPVETADFIIKHPAHQDGILWDNNAIQFLFRNPRLISDDQILQLLEAQDYEYAFFIYLNVLLEKFPDDRMELKNRLRKLFLNKEFENPREDLGAIVSRINAAEKLGLVEQAEELKKELHQFFASCKARAAYESIKELPNSRAYADHARAAFFINAPAEFREEYSKIRSSDVAIGAVLKCKGLSDVQRVEKLEQVLKTSIGRFSHEYMPVASQLDAVARFDLPLAEKWIAKLPDEGAQCWARMCIASGISKQNPEIAKQQIRRAFEDLKTMGQDQINTERAYNYPLPLIGAMGLRSVEFADRQYIPTAIKIVAEMAPSMLELPIADSRANYFEVTAGVARYDRSRALELFDKAKNEVDLHSAASYFVALAAIDPTRIAEEYPEIPLKPDSRGITYRPYIVNAIFKALSAEDDDAFWDELASHSHLTIPVPEK